MPSSCLRAKSRILVCGCGGDVKGYVLEKKRPYTKLYEDGKSSDSYEWEQIDSCCGEYYEDSDELIKVALEENGIKLKETA